MSNVIFMYIKEKGFIMKDKDNVLRQLDEADNMVQILAGLASKRAIQTDEAVRRLNEIRRKLRFVHERVTIS